MKSRKGEGNKILHCEERKTFLTLVWSLCFGQEPQNSGNVKKKPHQSWTSVSSNWSNAFIFSMIFRNCVYSATFAHGHHSSVCHNQVCFLRPHLNCPSGTIKIYCMTTTIRNHVLLKPCVCSWIINHKVTNDPRVALFRLVLSAGFVCFHSWLYSGCVTVHCHHSQ